MIPVSEREKTFRTSDRRATVIDEKYFFFNYFWTVLSIKVQLLYRMYNTKNINWRTVKKTMKELRDYKEGSIL
jgi:predicted transcriptional regulator